MSFFCISSPILEHAKILNFEGGFDIKSDAIDTW